MPDAGGNNGIQIYGNTVIDGNFEKLFKDDRFEYCLFLDVSVFRKPLDLAMRFGCISTAKELLKISCQSH